MAGVKCETVTVTVEDEQGHETRLVMPAYTRPTAEFEAKVNEIVSQYIAYSTMNGAGMSLGDFALYVVSQAATDPRRMS
jgi:hypothetical protein